MICAGPGSDQVDAGVGTDRVFGEGGDDDLHGGTGQTDLVLGGTATTTSPLGAPTRSWRVGRATTCSPATWRASSSTAVAGADRLVARSMKLSLYGGDGDDFIDGYSGSDFDVDAGPGNDIVDLAGGNDGSTERPVRGGPGNDVIHGEGGTDWVDAGDGDDQVDLGSGDGGWARGGAGNDDLTTGTTKNTQLRGDDGNDTLTLTEIGSRADGGANADALTGSTWNDVLVGGPGPDKIHGGEGDDTLSGSDGDDEMWGELGIDVCHGGSGNDFCDGGPLGTPEPSPSDPDLCLDDVETKRNCRGQEGDWSGTADGTLEHSGGIIESWSATVDLEELSPGYYWLGDADIAWTVSGTSDTGCVYDGSAALNGRAELAIFEEEGDYSVTVWSTTSHVEVEVDCPNEEPKTVLYRALNTNVGEADVQALPDAPVTRLNGNLTYVPNNAPEGSNSWSWDLLRTS